MSWTKWIALALLGAATVSAQEFPEFQRWMKATGSAAGNLGKLETKTGQPAVRSAEILGTVYENMITFWRQQGIAKAVGISELGKAAAVQLATAAHAGNAEKAAEAFQSLEKTCHSCHELTREKLTDGRYRIKKQS